MTKKLSAVYELPVESFDVDDCLAMLSRIESRLRALGWRGGVYMPKDGTHVDVIEFGSTGVFDCWYSGEWADGYFNVCDGHDVYPSRSAPLMFRPRLKVEKPKPTARLDNPYLDEKK